MDYKTSMITDEDRGTSLIRDAHLRRTLGIGLLKGSREALCLMSEVWAPPSRSAPPPSTAPQLGYEPCFPQLGYDRIGHYYE